MKRVENDEIDEPPPSFEQVSSVSSTPQPERQSNTVTNVPAPVKRTGLYYLNLSMKSSNYATQTPSRPKSR